MLLAISIKSWMQHFSKYLWFSHLPSIAQTIQIGDVGHFRGSRKRTHKRHSLLNFFTLEHQCLQSSENLHWLWTDTRCSQEDLLGLIGDRYGWWEIEIQTDKQKDRVKEHRTISKRRWWWWWWFFNFKGIPFILFIISIFTISLSVSCYPNTLRSFPAFNPDFHQYRSKNVRKIFHKVFFLFN